MSVPNDDDTEKDKEQSSTEYMAEIGHAAGRKKK
jgi:hypothetical protein